MANATPFVLNQASQDAFIAYLKQTLLTVNSVKSAQRARFEAVDRAYQREVDYTDIHNQAKLQNKGGNVSPVQNITVPIVMPQIEAAVVYQTSVFLTGVPIFGAVADAAFMDQALQLETKLDNDAIRGGWTKELMLSFRDGFKYNYAPMEVCWDKEKTPGLVTDVEFSAKEGKPTELLWAGNSLRRLDPYNTFVDPRVPPSEVYCKGEFAGYNEYLSRIELKQFIMKMSDSIIQNVTKAFESSAPGIVTTAAGEELESYYVPSINPAVNMDDNYKGNMSWLSWAGLSPGRSASSIEYKDSYIKTVLYCKILPSEFSLNVPAKNTPQIWKLIIINHSIIIHAERQTNAHGWIPILVGQPNEDGLSYQTKSLADNAIPFQEVTTAFMSSILASRRRAISDRTLFDPSRVLSAHINSENPSAKIPVRPAAYGKNIGEAVHQFPYKEDQGAFSITQIRDLIGMSNMLAGQNPARQGQFVKGNKTREEFADVMSNSNGRDQLTSILLEAQMFVPMKTIFKLNILQYQGAETLYSREKEKSVEIDPVALRKAVLEFKISDGLVPADKIISTDTLTVALQVLGSSPQIGASYNIAPLFSYLMKTKGAKINQFEKPQEQLAYEQAMAQWSNMAQMAIDKGMDISKLPPQPKPADYGYNPGTPPGTAAKAPQANSQQPMTQE